VCNSFPLVQSSHAVAESAPDSGREMVTELFAFAMNADTASINHAGTINANKICHSPPEVRFPDAELRLAPAICHWMHLRSRRVVGGTECLLKGNQGIVPKGASLPIRAKGVGVEVEHVQNSGSRSLARSGSVAAWSNCIPTLHVSTKTSE
jgi:hypothetical protein